MKKTLMTALLGLVMTGAASAAYTLGEVDYTTTTGMSTGSDNGTASYFKFTLSNDLFNGTATASNAITTASDASTSFTEVVGLTSIEVVSRYGNDSAVLPATLKITDVNGNLVATSSSSVKNGNVRHYDVFDSADYWTRFSFTFSFDELSSQLTVGETYTATFYDANGDAMQVGMIASKNGSGTGEGVAAAVMGTTPNYQPAGLVISTTSLVEETTPAVPEPTTATLSLLALAGLCARRRRK